MESHQQIEDQIARWLVRRDSDTWTQSDQAALTQWLNASTARVVAFVRQEAAWQRLQRLQSLGAGTPAGVVPSPDEWQLSPLFEKHVDADAATDLGAVAQPSRRVPWLKFGMAAAVATIACLIAARVWLFDVSSYSTPVGVISAVPMQDGSKVTLNTDSRIRVDISGGERRVQLDYGEAFFQVAKDPSRPFVVAVGDRRVVAVGTAFSVRRNADGTIRVAVTEGTVKIEQSGSSARHEQGSDVLLAAGSLALTSRDHVMLQEKPLAEVEESVSWRTGFLVFHQTALSDVVAELNRYNTRKIVLQDPQLAAIRLSGRFEPTQHAAFIRLLEDGFQIRAVNEDGRVVLTAR